MALTYVKETKGYIPKPTPMEVLRTAYRYFAKGGACGASADGSCVYRTQSGGRCAVGALIPDELFMPDMRGVVDGMISGYPETFPGWAEDKELMQLLRELQRLHDNVFLAHVSSTRSDPRVDGPRRVADRIYGYALAKGLQL